MKSDEVKKLEKTGYRFVGANKHSAIKICNWTRESLRGRNFCYKEKFYKKKYGIESHRCVQMTPAAMFCTMNCLFCWRFNEYMESKWNGGIDEPKEILDNAIKAHKTILEGFHGNPNVDKIKLHEAERPKNVALSLAGETLIYPKINELIEEILKRKMTAFLVTNGTLPDVLQKLYEPTQLYVTLPAPDEDGYKKTCKPLIKDGWKKILESLSFLNNFSCGTVIRLTLVRDMNFVHPEKYAKIIDKTNPCYCEIKSFMSIGGSRERLEYSQMPLFEDIYKFSEEISEISGYEIKDFSRLSRVVLLSR